MHLSTRCPLGLAPGLRTQTPRCACSSTSTCNPPNKSLTLSQSAIPETQFRKLANADFEAIKASGSVVIRDVIQDAVAEAWAAEYAAQGVHPTYYHSSLIAARAEPSILSATGVALQKVLGVEPAYTRVDALSHTPSETQWTGDKVWAAQPAEGTYMPLHAHVAFAPTDLGVPTSSHAALYSLLRPYFCPKASRISFYHPEDYLQKSNWTFTGKADASADPVHLKPAHVKLNPGDVLISHAGLPLQAIDAAGLLLPIHPLPACEGNKAFVTLQRTAFEAGLPPPHAIREGEACCVEEPGSSAEIDSVSGRRAMGYE